MAHEPKSEDKQEDSFYTVKFQKQSRENREIAGFIVPAPDKESALRTAQIHAGNSVGPNGETPEVMKSSVHKSHAYDLANSDIVRNNFEDIMYVVVDEHIDGEIRVDDLKNY